MAGNGKFTDEEALAYHLEPKPGKLEVIASTPMATQRDLSLAYSPGVAVPVKEIAKNLKVHLIYYAWEHCAVYQMEQQF